MFILQKVNEYSKQVIEYFEFRSPGQTNISRMLIGYRSHGLLEKHSISAAWVSMGCFSSLVLILNKYTKLRVLVLISYFSVLILSLNFSAIFAFIFVIFFVEYKGYLIFRGNISSMGIKKTIYSLSILFLILFILLYFNEVIFEIILFYTKFQIGLLAGDNLLHHLNDASFIGGMIRDIIYYPIHMLKFPPGILIGDGFSQNWGVYADGGDFGLVETMHHMGLPFFIACTIGLFSLVKTSLMNVELNLEMNSYRYNILYFSACVILYLFITSIHYTTWSAKSIFPILMISIAIIPRYKYNRVL